MGKDAGAPMILEDEQKTCEYPVHPLIPRESPKAADQVRFRGRSGIFG
jgi:hypothetical protein